MWCYAITTNQNEKWKEVNGQTWRVTVSPLVFPITPWMIGRMHIKRQLVLRLTRSDHATDENPAGAIGCRQHTQYMGVFAYT